MACAVSPTHWVTLNLHRSCPLDVAEKKLDRWRIEVQRRLFGQKFFLKPDYELISYVGFPEFTAAGHPHFHLCLRSPLAVTRKFCRIAAVRWKRIVPTGTSYIQLVDDDEHSPLRMSIYATKDLDPRSPVPFVHSRIHN
jgi:hypothetical protein